MIEVIVNGESKKIKEGTTVRKLLQALGIEEKTMASAVNMQVVKKEDWERYTLRNGDKVEFLHFVGGG